VRLERRTADPTRVSVDPSALIYRLLHRLSDVVRRAALNAPDLFDRVFSFEDILVLDLNHVTASMRMLPEYKNDITRSVLKDHELGEVKILSVRKLHIVFDHRGVKVPSVFTLDDDVADCFFVLKILQDDYPVGVSDFQRSVQFPNSPMVGKMVEPRVSLHILSYNNLLVN